MVNIVTRIGFLILALFLLTISFGEEFPVALDDIPITAVRVYTRDTGLAESCCIAEAHKNDAILAGCLDVSAHYYTALAAALAKPHSLVIGEGARKTSGAPGTKEAATDNIILMMTSKSLRASYALFAEATAAQFIAASTEEAPWEFFSVEIDDTPEASIGGRAPHWLKVPVLFYALKR